MNAHETLITAAASLGIRIEDLSKAWSQPAVRLSQGDCHEIVFAGTGFGSTPLLATTISTDLPILRHYLNALEIPCPKGVVFKLEEEHTSKAQLNEILGSFWQEGRSHVCRPAYEHSGVGMATNLQRLEDLELHLDTYADEFATWIVEQQVDGEDLQLLAIGGRLVAGILRNPLKLQGDGVQTLEELIDAHNLKASLEDRIEIDAETRQLLRDQAVFLSEQVPAGKWVVLKNPGAGGGEATDVTSRLHSRYGDWITRVASETGLQHFTMHTRSAQIDSDPADTASVIGVDARPDWLAFQQAKGNTRDIATLILNVLFGSDGARPRVSLAK